MTGDEPQAAGSRHQAHPAQHDFIAAVVDGEFQVRDELAEFFSQRRRRKLRVLSFRQLAYARSSSRIETVSLRSPGSRQAAPNCWTGLGAGRVRSRVGLRTGFVARRGAGRRGWGDRCEATGSGGNSGSGVMVVQSTVERPHQLSTSPCAHGSRTPAGQRPDRWRRSSPTQR